MKIDKQPRMEIDSVIDSSNSHNVKSKSGIKEKNTQANQPIVRNKETSPNTREILWNTPAGSNQSMQAAISTMNILEEKARSALANRKPDGSFSPEDAQAIEEYAVRGYTLTASSSASARIAYKEQLPPISPDEEQRWNSVMQQVPANFQASISKISPLKNITAMEVAGALMHEPGFAVIAQGQEFRQFVKELTDVINAKTAEMGPTDKGMALIFKFPATYGEVGHIALGSIWRDMGGKIQLSINHQESMAPTKASGAYTGRIYNTFDTSSTYPTGIAPVVEEMKLFGPPSVNVYPVPYPEKLTAYTDVFSDHDAHERSYAPTSDWPPAAKSTIPKNMHKETCFNTTHKSMARLYGLKTSHMPTMPTVFERMKGFAGLPEEALKEIEINKNTYKLDKVSSDKKLVVPGFMTLGSRWIDSGRSDIAGKRKGKTVSLSFQPGQVGFNLEKQVTQFKFSSEANDLTGITLDKKPVIKGKVYTADEAAKMVYSGEKTSKKVQYIIAIPAAAPISIAKL